MYYIVYIIIVCNWNDFDLFYHVPNYNIISKADISKEKLNYICVFKLQKIKISFQNNKILFDYIWCDLLVEMMKSRIFKKNLKKYYLDNTHDENNIIFYLYYQIFTKLLILNSNVKAKVNSFMNNFKSKPFIGIQLRVGNDDLHEYKRTGLQDIEIMINIAKNNRKYKFWYLTGDSQKYKNKLYKEYKNVIVYSRNKTKHYERFTKDATIIIEHEILSKSNFLIISKSTYSFTALLKSGLLLSNRKMYSYVIYNRSAYDLKKYFTFFQT